jgi:hypothetical protein
MKLYHGTSIKRLPLILEEGVKPRGKKKGNWSTTITSNPRAVYLTTAYPLYFANAASKGSDASVIFEIDTDLLDHWLLAPDEDFLEQATRGSPQFASITNKNMIERTKWFRKRAFTKFQHEWQRSLNGLGTCCYYSEINPESITRYATIERKAPIQRLSDPSISIVNFKLLGGFYRNLVSKIFNYPITEKNIAPLFDKWLEQVDRKGISVITLHGVEGLTKLIKPKMEV